MDARNTNQNQTRNPSPSDSKTTQKKTSEIRLNQGDIERILEFHFWNDPRHIRSDMEYFIATIHKDKDGSIYAKVKTPRR